MLLIPERGQQSRHRNSFVQETAHVAFGLCQVIASNPGLSPGTLVIEHAFLADAAQRERASRLRVGITVQQPLLYAQGAQLLAGWGKGWTGQILPIRGWLRS